MYCIVYIFLSTTWHRLYWTKHYFQIWFIFFLYSSTVQARIVIACTWSMPNPASWRVFCTCRCLWSSFTFAKLSETIVKRSFAPHPSDWSTHVTNSTGAKCVSHYAFDFERKKERKKTLNNELIGVSTKRFVRLTVSLVCYYLKSHTSSFTWSATFWPSLLMSHYLLV
jgi:hypothetical protein